MGEIEKEAKTKRRRTNVQKIILNSLLVAGVVSIAVLAPNAVQILDQLDGGKKRKKNPKYVVNTVIGRLVEQGFVRFEKTDRGTFARITPKGEEYLKIADREDFKIKKPLRWDKRWRVVIFDIKENRKNVREKLRRTLVHFGFLRLQNSVWVFPYDCEDLIVLLKADFEIGKDVLYIIAEKIENDVFLKDYFELE